MMEEHTQPEKSEKEEKGKSKSSDAVPYNKNAKTIQELGYHFKDRKLVDVKTGGKFQFIDQAHYEVLGDLIVTEIQNILIVILQTVI